MFLEGHWCRWKSEPPVPVVFLSADSNVDVAQQGWMDSYSNSYKLGSLDWEFKNHTENKQTSWKEICDEHLYVCAHSSYLLILLIMEPVFTVVFHIVWWENPSPQEQRCAQERGLAVWEPISCQQWIIQGWAQEPRGSYLFRLPGLLTLWDRSFKDNISGSLDPVVPETGN